MKPLKLSKKHSIRKSRLTGKHALSETQSGKVECTGTYTECFKLAKELRSTTLPRTKQ